MNTPQFAKGQTLTAEAMNQLAQNQRELANRVGRAGLAPRYAGPQQLSPLPNATGEPAYLPPLAAPASDAGVYLRTPWVEDAFRTQFSTEFDLTKITRSNGSPLEKGDEIFQAITVDDKGAFLSSALRVFPETEAPDPTPLWEPGSGESSVLFRRIGSVIQDPRFATATPNGSSVFRPLVVNHHDGAIPILPRPAVPDSGSVQMVAALTGSTLPIKNLVGGDNVTLTDHGSSVTIAATGGGGGGGSYTPEIVGFVNLAGSSVLFQDMQTEPIRIAYLFLNGVRLYITAQNINGFIQINTTDGSASSVNA